MVQRIGQGGSLQREAILAAMKAQARAVDDVHAAAAGVSAAVSGANAPKTAETAFAGKLQEGLRAVESNIRSAERLPQDLVEGRVSDFAEVAAKIKRADLSLRFALEIRNKLVDAYREVMRMNV